MSKYIVKTMHLEKPKHLIIWKGESTWFAKGKTPKHHDNQQSLYTSFRIGALYSI